MKLSEVQPHGGGRVLIIQPHKLSYNVELLLLTRCHTVPTKRKTSANDKDHVLRIKHGLSVSGAIRIELTTVCKYISVLAFLVMTSIEIIIGIVHLSCLWEENESETESLPSSGTGSAGKKAINLRQLLWSGCVCVIFF